MSVRSRQAKVFAALLISITAGAIILKALGNNPPSAGAFCLSRYYRLDPVEKIIISQAAQYAGRWSHIEIYYSGTAAPTKSDNVVTCGCDGLDAGQESRCHFIICNGRIGHDGQILSTEIWQRQCSPHQLHQSGQRSIGVGQLQRDKTPTSRGEWTIYICVIAGDKGTKSVRNPTMVNMIQKGKISNGARPTDFQIKRTEALVEALSRRFNIWPESIHYPDNWQ